MFLYNILVWFHVLFTIIAVGTNITYGVWINRAGRDDEKMNFVLRSIFILDNRFVVPSYILLLLTGLLMVFTGPYNFGNGWIDISLVLYVILLIILFFVYKPALKNQIKFIRDGFDTNEYKSAAKKTRVMGILIAILVLAIIFFMVTKPSLWA